MFFKQLLVAFMVVPNNLWLLTGVPQTPVASVVRSTLRYSPKHKNMVPKSSVSIRAFLAQFFGFLKRF